MRRLPDVSLLCRLQALNHAGETFPRHEGRHVGVLGGRPAGPVGRVVDEGLRLLDQRDLGKVAGEDGHGLLHEIDIGGIVRRGLALFELVEDRVELGVGVAGNGAEVPRRFAGRGRGLRMEVFERLPGIVEAAAVGPIVIWKLPADIESLSAVPCCTFSSASNPAACNCWGEDDPTGRPARPAARSAAASRRHWPTCRCCPW